MAGGNALNLRQNIRFLRDSRGVTLVELVVVISIIVILATIGVVSLTGGLLTSETKARSQAEDLRQYLNYARIAAVGQNSPVIVAFNPTEKFYYACIDTDNNNDCSDAETKNIPLPKPDEGTNFSGTNVRGQKLKYEAIFGGTAPATKTLSGTIQRTADGIYYMDASTTDINPNGMHTTATPTTHPRFVFNRDGSAQGGSVYLYLISKDTSYHYAINVSTRGKVDLYQWLNVGGTYRWRLISTR